MAKQSRQPAIVVEGLSLLRPTKSRKYWRIKGRLPNGESVDTTAGTTQSKAVATARALVDYHRRKMEPGAANQGRVTYEELLSRFLDPERQQGWGRSGGSRHADSSFSLAKNHVIPVIGNRYVEDLRPEDFILVLRKLELANYSPYTRQNVGVLMRGSITFARRNRYIAQGYDPMEGVSYTAVKDGVRWVPFADRPAIADVDRFADEMRDVAGGAWWLAVYVAAYSGPRWGELIYLTPEHFDIEQCLIRIEHQWVEHDKRRPSGIDAMGQPGGTFVKALPKNGTQRSIPFPRWMIPQIEERIAAVKAEHEATYPHSGRSKNPLRLMFCTPEGTIPRRSSWNRHRISPARQAAVWPSSTISTPKGKETLKYRWGWHSLRHHCASWLISREGLHRDHADAAKIIGDNIDTFLKMYVQAPTNYLDSAADAMAEELSPAERRTLAES
jgi:integrase